MPATPSPAAASSTRLHFAGWTLDPEAHRLIDRDGRAAALSASAFALLHILAAHAGETLSREVLSAVLCRRYSPEDRLIDVHVSRIRRVLGSRPDGSGYIRTLRNAGYVFICPVERR